MSVDFKKLFADKAAYGDDLKITLANGNELTLGDLRAYNAQTGGELQKELDRQKADLDNRAQTLKKAEEKTANLFIELESQRKALEASNGGNGGKPTPADPLERYERDEVFGPVVKSMREQNATLSTKLDEVTKNLDKVVKSVASMGTTYMGDKARNDFAALPADDPVRPKDLSLDSLYKFAVERRIYDSNNIPDVKEAYATLTRDARHKHEVAEAEKRGREARDREIAEGAMLPRPVSGLPPLPEGVKPPINMADAFAKAGTDKDMWRGIMTESGAA